MGDVRARHQVETKVEAPYFMMDALGGESC